MRSFNEELKLYFQKLIVKTTSQQPKISIVETSWKMWTNDVYSAFQVAGWNPDRRPDSIEWGWKCDKKEWILDIIILQFTKGTSS